MTILTQSDLDDMRRKAEAAVPGVWTLRKDDLMEAGKAEIDSGIHFINGWSAFAQVVITMNGEPSKEGEANADYIVAVQPRKVLALLDHITDLTVELDQAAGVIEDRNKEIADLICDLDTAKSNTGAACAHIAQLTAERDEARAECKAERRRIDKVFLQAQEWRHIAETAKVRIAELEAQPSAQFVAGMRRGAEIVKDNCETYSTAGGDERKALSPRRSGDLAGLSYATAILTEAALKGKPSPQIEASNGAKTRVTYAELLEAQRSDNPPDHIREAFPDDFE